MGVGQDGGVPTFDRPVRVAATGSRSADDVWARYTEPRRWSSWAPHVQEVDYPHDVVTPGTSGRVTGLGGVVAVFSVDEVDHTARTWSWRVRTGPLRLRFEHGVDEGAERVTAWVVVHALLPVAVGYAPVARWSLGRLVSG